MNSNIAMPWYGWVLLELLLLSQSTWLFINAKKREHYPWFWGLIGLIQFPMPLLFYFIFVRKIFKNRIK